MKLLDMSGITVGFLLVAAVALFSSPPVHSQEKPSAGLITLLANPDKFDGKQITVIGYLVLDRQKKHIPGAFLFLHEEDAKNLLPNSAQVIPSEQMLRDAEKIDGLYVLITGVVHAKDAVIIRDVQTCKAWSDPRRPLMSGGSPPSDRK